MKQYVVLSHTPWAHGLGRIQQLTARLGKGEVLFFQPAASLVDGSWKKDGKQVRPHVTLYTLPPVWSFAGRAGEIPRPALRRQIRFVEERMTRHGFRSATLWLTSPEQFFFIDRLPVRGLIYDCDRFWPHELDDRESRLALAADVIFAASPLLRERLSPCNSNVALVPNGVNYPMFSRSHFGVPPLFHGISGPILGWCGSLGDGLDLMPVEAAAKQHPEWTVVLLGRREGCDDLSRLKRLPNVRIPGACPMMELPEYLGRFHVLLNLRRPQETESDVIPCRMYEYLATGKPIVSRLLPDEVEDFPDVVYGAHSTEEFVRLCERALTEDSEWVAERRRNYGEGASWSRRGEEVRKILDAIVL